jgi:hypothetical protein
MVGDREKLLGEGFNGYMSKPITPQTFIDQMSPYLPTEEDKPLTREIKFRKPKTRVA